MTRANLKKITQHRIKEARLLLDHNNYSGAYYLAGYAIECALKACISRKISGNTIPEKKFIVDCYTHNLKDLIKLADLDTKRINFAKANLNFATNWNIVIDWNESAKYEIFTELQARQLYESITSKNGGILSWIQQYW